MPPQRAKRIGAVITSLPVDHVPLLSQPHAVVGLIEQVAAFVETEQMAQRT